MLKGIDFFVEDAVSCLDGVVGTSATTGSFGGGLMNMLPFVAIIAIMYFLMIRPQQKKEKQRQEMVAALKRGDRVLTTGGLIGTVHKVIGDGELLVEIAEGTRVRLLSGAVTQLLDKTATPHPAETEEKADETKAKPKTVKKTVTRKTPASKTTAAAAKSKTSTATKTVTRRKKTASE